MNSQLYNDYGTWLRNMFPFRVQKISIDAGFTCPNRDGHVGTGGCTFCNNRTFNPSYCNPQLPISTQLKEGKRFFARKYPDMKYLAYFQAYTNTYAKPLDELKRMYEEVLNTDDIVGIVIGTRPDCITEKLLDYLADLARQTFVIVEYGIESANENTLKTINRGHSFECSKNTIEETAQRGIMTGGHIIIGLPGEDIDESIRQAPIISSLKLDTLKIHQLQIIKGTKLAEVYASKPFHTYTIEEYIKLIAHYLQLLRKDLIIERFISQSPPSMVISPKWGLKNHEFTNLLVNYMHRHGMYQGQMAEKYSNTDDSHV